MVSLMVNNKSTGTSLGILIPTRNRAVYLEELINTLMPQTEGLSVNVYVGDNCSTDRTEEVVRSAQATHSNLRYQKNVINIGGDANFLTLVHACTDDYFWLFGDDEVLQPFAIPKLVKILQTKPDYIVFDGIDSEYTDVKGYISSRFKIRSEFLASCSLITTNVVKRNIFDINYASTKYATHYGHMYALFAGLKTPPVKIISCRNVFFSVRKERAEPVDGDWPLALELEWHKYLRFLAELAEVKYPWFRLGLIQYRRRIRHLFGNAVTKIIGKGMKKSLKNLMVNL